MTPKWIELVTGSLEQKKQYRQYKARIDALPEPYGTAAKALQRYLMYAGGIVLDGETALKMFGDVADLWERAVADGTPIRVIVGDDPVEFADALAQAYTGKHWIDKERARLTDAITRAEEQDAGGGAAAGSGAADDDPRRRGGEARAGDDTGAGDGSGAP